MISEDKIKLCFSTNLRRLMKEKKITETTLANITEISQSAINRMKNGLVCPSLHHSVLIADALNAPLDALITEVKDDKRSTISYIPIISSKDLMLNKEKKIVGFYTNDTLVDESVIGFKYDNSFASNTLNKDSIIIIKLAKKVPSNNSVLFAQNNKYLIGNAQNKVIRSLDNLEQTFGADEINIIGQILKIETTYVKEPKAIKKLISTLGDELISKILGQLPMNIASFA